VLLLLLMLLVAAAALRWLLLREPLFVRVARCALRRLLFFKETKRRSGAVEERAEGVAKTKKR
jgi:hypothetical protein